MAVRGGVVRKWIESMTPGCGPRWRSDLAGRAGGAAGSSEQTVVRDDGTIEKIWEKVEQKEEMRL